ncbi:hypothetical protein PAPYR_12681 [Paratrimastix pyriformis]|uniref:AAA+ ATPase domain-containing protein n=1 Tax=Paratrimastix pyriformis TaxID=342808 RepID=A0ABQ8U1G2_9EUKA|nr:hypothetical protein PAPYR_12681 [Paratrimastix pyriformis]
MDRLTPRQAQDDAEFRSRLTEFDLGTFTREPFTCIIYGTPRSGKSYLLRWLLSEISQLYDIVYVFSISSDAIGYYSEVGIDEAHVLPGFDDPKSRRVLEHMISRANQVVARYNKQGFRVPASKILPRTLIICDDIISPGGEQRNNGVLNSLVTNYRHLNMSLIMTTQYVNSVSKVMRETVDHHILFKHESKTALDYFACSCFAWAHWKPSVQYIISTYTGDHRCIIVNKRSETTSYTIFKAPPKNQSIPLVQTELIDDCGSHERESASHDTGDEEISGIGTAAEDEAICSPDESGCADAYDCWSSDIVVS